MPDTERMPAESDVLEVASVDALRGWLAANGERSASVWLVRHRKGHPAHLTYDEIVNACIAFGWVDSQPRKLDAGRSLIRLSPRDPKSNWSAVNKARVARLERDGLMTGSGRRMVALAKERGTWTFLNDVDRLEEPDDLAKALDAQPEARRLWDRFPPSSRRGILEWIKVAKTDATRQTRIALTVERAAENRKANFPAGRDRGPKDGGSEET